MLDIRPVAGALGAEIHGLDLSRELSAESRKQVRELLDHIEAERFEIEVSQRYERDVYEDADVGAYIVMIDGEKPETRAAPFSWNLTGTLSCELMFQNTTRGVS